MGQGVDPAAKAEYDRKDREAYRRAGLCQHCRGRAKVGPGSSTACPACAERIREYSRQRRRDLLAAGRCRQCGQPNDRSGKSRCSRCAPGHSADVRQRQVTWRQTGRCGDCGKPALPGQYRCAGCRDAHNRRQEAHRGKRRQCKHPQWRCRMEFAGFGDDARVKVRRQERCLACGQRRQQTFWATAERVAEVLRWFGGLEVSR